jgi:hypothetical protein
MGDGRFQAGNNANPNGRPVGSRNKRTQEVLDLIQARGDKDPLDALSDLITNNKDPAIVAQASNILAPYLHSKRSVTAPAPRYIDSPVQVPEFTSIADAENFLASLPVMLGKGELDSQTSLELSTLTRNWLSARYEREELQLKLTAQGGGPEQTIHITGGLPAIPGTNVTMPVLNGADIDGHALLEAAPGPQTADPDPNNAP